MTNDPEKLTVDETPLAKCHVSEPEETQSNIFKFIFENATKMYQGRNYDKDEMKLKNNKQLCKVESELTINENNVEF